MVCSLLQELENRLEQRTVDDEGEEEPLKAKRDSLESTGASADSSDEEKHDLLNSETDEKAWMAEQEQQLSLEVVGGDLETRTPEEHEKEAESSSERSPTRLSGSHMQSDAHKEKVSTGTDGRPRSEMVDEAQALMAASMAIPIYAPVGRYCRNV